MKVLVTGGAGLIGMAARKTLAARGHEVTAIDITNFGRNDPELMLIGLAERAPLEKLIDDAGIEAIIHCGAISGPMLAKGQPLLLVSSNIDGTALCSISRASEICDGSCSARRSASTATSARRSSPRSGRCIRHRSMGRPRSHANN
jgi:UDP-glucose 4-epimerase